ncbi:MAG: ABC transporter permease subunit, partial [Mogibacterium sp.]|nr:ABC transporter permease subunit [Mogibacterium sp.]
MKLADLFVKNPLHKPSWAAKLLNAVLVAAVVAGFIMLSLKMINLTMDFTFLSRYTVRFKDGFIMTLEVSICAMILSMVIGILSAACSHSKILFLQYLNLLYVKFIRGTPLLMQIYLFFYIIGTAWGINNRFVAGVLILSIFEGAYISEIIRGSFNSIEGTQKEAGLASGFTRMQT